MQVPSEVVGFENDLTVNMNTSQCEFITSIKCVLRLVFKFKVVSYWLLNVFSVYKYIQTVCFKHFTC